MKLVIRVELFLILTCLYLIQCENNDNILIINDNNFLKALIELGVDQNKDGKISPGEAETVTSLNLRNDSIVDMKGIELFINLEWLSCDLNQIISLDLSRNTNLRYLNCNENQLQSLDVSNNEDLEVLYGSSNQIRNLNVSNNTDLIEFRCLWNQLTSLYISEIITLTILHCQNDQLTALNVSNKTALIVFNCAYNQLTTLDLSNNIALKYLIV